VIESRKPADWTSFLAACEGTEVPADFLGEKERRQGTQDRDPFLGWTE
jgi:antitoxin VapB